MILDFENKPRGSGKTKELLSIIQSHPNPSEVMIRYRFVSNQRDIPKGVRFSHVSGNLLRDLRGNNIRLLCIDEVLPSEEEFKYLIGSSIKVVFRGTLDVSRFPYIVSYLKEYYPEALL